MNENIDLTKILKDAPEGTRLWSPIYGDCEFMEIRDDNDGYPVACPVACKVRLKGHHAYVYFSPKGEYYLGYDNTECVLFPSRKNRDWSKFEVPAKHKKFKPFEKVLRVAGNNPDYKMWVADFYSHYDEAIGKHYLISGFYRDDDEIIPYEGNENLLGTYVDK